MGEPGTWNARALWPSKIPPRIYLCDTCGREDEWTQIGDIPTHCQPCSRKLHLELRGEQSYMKPWAIDEAGEGTILEQMDRILHWSPVTKRWLFYDGKRWVKGYHQDGFKITKAVMLRNGVTKFHFDDVMGNRRQIYVYELMEEFQRFCSERMGM